MHRFDITWKKDGGVDVSDTHLNSRAYNRISDGRGTGYPEDVDLTTAAGLQGAFSTKLEEVFSQIKDSKNK